MSSLKKGSFYFLGLLVSALATLLVLEGTSWAYLKITSPKSTPSFFLSRFKTYARNNYYIRQKWLDPDFPGVTHAWPYFGYSQKSGGLFNNFGFLESNHLPYKKKTDEIVVGVFGGSVASGWALYISRDSNESQRVELAKALNIYPKKLVFLNFSSGGYKQPQQFIISSYFSDQIDLAFNIDGYNDIMFGPGSDFFPPDFPFTTGLFYFLDEQKKQIISKLLFCKTLTSRLTMLPVEFPLVSNSALYYLIWAKLTPLLEKKVAKNTRLLESSPGLLKQPIVDRSNYPGAIELYKAKIWKKYTLMQAVALKSQGVTSLFFIQPNLHRTASKPFSDTELQLRTQHVLDSEVIHNRIQLLTGLLPELREQKVKIFDLVNAFLQSNETVYTDSCCHFNDEGNRLMTTELVKLLRTMDLKVSKTTFQ